MSIQIYPVPLRSGEFQWKWRSESGDRESACGFDLYYDCVEDARAHGAEVELAAGHPGAPGTPLC